MKSRAEIEQALPHFTGSETWTRLMANVLLTDGARFVAESADAFWLMNEIAAYQAEPKVRAEDMQFWKLVVTDGSALLTMVRDSGEPELVRKAIAYTDFPLPEIDLWLQFDGQCRVIMLKSEY